jgi:hypothetical protein
MGTLLRLLRRLLLLCAVPAARSGAASSRPPPAPLELANAAVRARFSGATGELLDLINLQSGGGGGDDDYLKQRVDVGEHVALAGGGIAKPQPPFCAQSSNSHYYIKVGGDPAVTSGWKGPPTDRCCRAKDASGDNCRWFANKAECEAALPGWRTLCLSCASSDKPIGCPTFQGGAAPLGGDSHGLFLAWIDAPVPPMAEHTGWAGGTPDPHSGLPGDIKQAIGPQHCNLTAHALTTDPSSGATSLKMTLSHRPTSLRFHVTASLPSGDSGALNLSLQVELPPPLPGPQNEPTSTLDLTFARWLLVSLSVSSYYAQLLLCAHYASIVNP